MKVTKEDIKAIKAAVKAACGPRAIRVVFGVKPNKEPTIDTTQQEEFSPVHHTVTMGKIVGQPKTMGMVIHLYTSKTRREPIYEGLHAAQYLGTKWVIYDPYDSQRRTVTVSTDCLRIEKSCGPAAAFLSVLSKDALIDCLLEVIARADGLALNQEVDFLRCYAACKRAIKLENHLHPLENCEFRAYLIRTRHPGMCLEDRTICAACAAACQETGIPATPENFPDGFTCADCGEEHLT